MTHNAWRREMTTRIINLRAIDRDNTALRNDVATGALIPIGPQLVFPAAHWRSLRLYQRQSLRNGEYTYRRARVRDDEITRHNGILLIPFVLKRFGADGGTSGFRWS